MVNDGLALPKKVKPGSDPGSRGMGTALHICKPECVRLCVGLGFTLCLAPTHDLTAASVEF